MSEWYIEPMNHEFIACLVLRHIHLYGIIVFCTINTLRAKFFREHKIIYLRCMSFLHIDVDSGSWNPSSSKTLTYIIYIANIKGADVLATQGASSNHDICYDEQNYFGRRMLRVNWYEVSQVRLRRLDCLMQKYTIALTIAKRMELPLFCIKSSI